MHSNILIILFLTLSTALGHNPNCPMYKLVAPALGCHYEYDIDANGCQVNPHQVCDDPLLNGTLPCPVYSLIAPEPGCYYNWTKNEQGCEEPQLVCDENRPWPCPLAMPPPLIPGCTIETRTDEHGCEMPYRDCGNMTQCEINRAEMQLFNNTFVPECDNATGDFMPKQCDASAGECWCVNAKTGVELFLTRTTGELEDCERACPPNEEWNECGSACPDTCEDILNPNPAKICTMQCIIGCACARGYARDANGRCVTEEECRSARQCGPNEELKQCGTACPLTCDQVVNPQVIACPEICHINVCQCKDGYALDENQRCVLARECFNGTVPHKQCLLPRLPAPKVGCEWVFEDNEEGCPVNWHMECNESISDACATVRCQEGFQCQVVGGSAQCTLMRACPVFMLTKPEPGCHYEYEKDENGCDRPHQVCDQECGPNEEFTECGTVCPLTCEDVRTNNTIKPCPAMCQLNVCQCKSGYALDDNKRCVLQEECTSGGGAGNGTNGENPCSMIDPMPCTTCVATSNNEAKIIPSGGPDCCNDTIVNCFIAPCQSAKISNTCPEAAHCVDSYCGGCIAVFYDEDYNQICQN